MVPFVKVVAKISVCFYGSVVYVTLNWITVMSGWLVMFIILLHLINLHQQSKLVCFQIETLPF